MANTFTSLHYQVIFSPKNREARIQDIEQRVWSYLGGIARENDMKTLLIEIAHHPMPSRSCVATRRPAALRRDRGLKPVETHGYHRVVAPRRDPTAVHLLRPINSFFLIR